MYPPQATAPPKMEPGGGKGGGESEGQGGKADEGGTKNGGDGFLEEPPPVFEDGVSNAYPHLGSKVLYFLYSIRLYTSACCGANRVTEGICTRILPLSRCADLVTSRWCIPAVKAAVLEFMCECHLDLENQVRRKFLGFRV